MGQSFQSRILPPRAALFTGIGGIVALFGACMNDPAGISGDDATGGQHSHTGGSASGGTASSASGGSHHAGTGSDAAGDGGENTGSGGSGASPTGGSNAGGSGGTTDTGGANSTGGTAGDDAQGGDAGDDGAGGSDDETTEYCVFHSAPTPNAGGMGGAGGMTGSGGMAGSAGAAGASGDVTIRVSPFLGNYLADATGRALYFYGNDLTGDCTTPPASRCTADCAVTWPPFNAGARTLVPGLDGAAFGTIQRGDGTYQTTYYGWPLYYYKDDVAPASLAGQGKGKTWHIAEVKLPSVVIMREGTVKYLADMAGRTLYVSSADQVGTSEVDPESRCTGACAAKFKRFSVRNLAVVQSLEPDDFWSFVSPDGALQLGYKGAPLYTARGDRKAGDMTGTAEAGFTAALP